MQFKNIIKHQSDIYNVKVSNLVQAFFSCNIPYDRKSTRKSTLINVFIITIISIFLLKGSSLHGYRTQRLHAIEAGSEICEWFRY